MCLYLKKIWSSETVGLAKPMTRQTYQNMRCRKCSECHQQKATEWSLRSEFENDDQPCGCFLTLTYADTHPTTGEPAPWHLVKKHIQDFKKRFRRYLDYNKYTHKIKTFDCGEYGDITFRPHYHMLVYGFDFPDKYKHGASPKGHPVFNSNTLDKLWGHGHATIQALTKASAAYSALYACKTKESLPEHLRPYPEYNTMSHNIGTNKLLKKIDTYLKTDEIWCGGQKHLIPQYILDKVYPVVRIGMPYGQWFKNQICYRKARVAVANGESFYDSQTISSKEILVFSYKSYLDYFHRKGELVEVKISLRPLDYVLLKKARRDKARNQTQCLSLKLTDGKSSKLEGLLDDAIGQLKKYRADKKRLRKALD